jgi:hypothetical protein
MLHMRTDNANNRHHCSTLGPVCFQTSTDRVCVAVAVPFVCAMQAADSRLAAAAAGKHLPVRPLEEQVYKQRLGDTAYLVRVYA